jgi:hypothetical protein
LLTCSRLGVNTSMSSRYLAVALAVEELRPHNH